MINPPTALSHKDTNITIYVIGDTIYDYWNNVKVDRIAPDVPAPVWQLTGARTFAPGGAANLARQFHYLGADITLATLCPSMESLASFGLRVLSRNSGVATKARYVSAGHVLARVDSWAGCVLSTDQRRWLVTSLLEEVDQDIKKTDGMVVVLCSDYAQGFWSAETAQIAMAMCKKHCVPVLVDPKPRGVTLDAWRGCTALKLNESEARQFIPGLPPENNEFAAQRLSIALDGADVIITRGGRYPVAYTSGSLCEPCTNQDLTAGHPLWASGAGDCFLAYLAAGVARGDNLASAVEAGHYAARCYVDKPFNHPVHPREIGELRNLPGSRIYHDSASLKARLSALPEGTRIGYTNGVFDLFHPGHATLLRYARSECDFLVVAVNTSESCQRIKGYRPVMATGERLATLEACRDVDALIQFHQDTPDQVYRELGPCDVLVKGGDWRGRPIVGQDLARRLVFVPEREHIHTTGIRQRMRKEGAT